MDMPSADLRDTLEPTDSQAGWSVTTSQGSEALQRRMSWQQTPSWHPLGSDMHLILGILPDSTGPE